MTPRALIRLADEHEGLPELILPLEAVTSSFAITGKKRTGKSNTSVVFCEGLYQAGLPFVVIDPKGDWYGMRSGPDGQPAGGLPIPIFGGEHADFPLSPDAGDYMARLIVDRNLTCILDVSEFRPRELRRFVKAFIGALYRANRTPRMVVLEEAQEIAPQIKQAGRGDDGDLEMVAAVKRFVKLGGFKGLGTCLVTQRFQDVDKGVTTQVETVVVHRTTGPQDKKAIKDWVDGTAEQAELVDQLSGLGDGEAWVWSPHFLGTTMRVRMRRRSTFDSGATPKVGEPVRVATLADLRDERIEEAMASAIDQARQNDPAELRKQLRSRDDEIRELRHKLDEQPAAPAEPFEVPVLDDMDRTLLGDLLESIRSTLEKFEGSATIAHLPRPDTRPATNPVRAAVEQHQRERAVLEPRVSDPARFVEAPLPLTRIDPAEFVKIKQPPPARSAPTPPAGDLSRQIIATLILHGDLSRAQLGVHVGKSSKGGYFQRILSNLKQEGYIEGSNAGLSATASGRAWVGPVAALPEGDALVAWWVQNLGGQGSLQADIILAALAAWPTVLSKQELGEAVGKSGEGGYFQRVVSKLRNLGLMEGFAPSEAFLRATGR